MIPSFVKRLPLALILPMALSLVIGSVSPAVGQTAKTKTGEKPQVKLDLNTATEKEMVAELPGVGEATAKKIIDGRPYTSVDDLAKAGVPAKTIDAIRPMVQVVAAKPRPGMVKQRQPSTPTPKAATTANELTSKVNLNTATSEELQELPGIGPALAKEIIDSRPHKAIEDLEKLKGFGKSKFAAIKDHVEVAKAPSETKPTTVEKAAKKPVMAKKATESTPKTKTAKAAVPVSGKPVNINTASKEELDALPGIGPVKAQAILDARPFKKIEDIMKVKGIKEGEFGKIKDMITVD